MSSSSLPPLAAAQAGPVTVVGPQFTVVHPVELTIMSTNSSFCDDGSFTVTAIDGSEMFKVKGSSVFSCHTRRVLLDKAGIPIVTLRPKTISVHRRWRVYNGDSTDNKDLLYTAKLSSIFQFKTNIDVFLASNTTEEVPDFKVKSSWFERSSTIYLGTTNTIIAKMHKKQSFKTIIQGKTMYVVTVYPNVDFAFIISLVVAKHEIARSKDGGGAGDGS